jgi:hypothetical protein
LRLRDAASDDFAGFAAADFLAERAAPVHLRGEICPFESAAGAVPTSRLTAPFLTPCGASGSRPSRSRII